MTPAELNLALAVGAWVAILAVAGARLIEAIPKWPIIVVVLTLGTLQLITAWGATVVERTYVTFDMLIAIAGFIRATVIIVGLSVAFAVGMKHIERRRRRTNDHPS